MEISNILSLSKNIVLSYSILIPFICMAVNNSLLKN